MVIWEEDKIQRIVQWSVHEEWRDWIKILSLYAGNRRTFSTPNMMPIVTQTAVTWTVQKCSFTFIFMLINFTDSLLLLVF